MQRYAVGVFVFVFVFVGGLVLSGLALSQSPQATLSDAEFDTVVATYRAATVKPVLPEEARKYEIQAQGAVNDKSFDEAAGLYAQALAIAPWWPEGHFDRALVLAEVKKFDEAVVEMQRYLKLAPDAPDARAAQDKIYDWQRRAELAKQRWIALAWGPGSSGEHIGYDFSTQADAESEAITGCQKTGTAGCSLVYGARDKCVAVAQVFNWSGAVLLGGGYGAASSKSDAEALAMSNCKQYGFNCSVVSEACTSTVIQAAK